MAKSVKAYNLVVHVPLTPLGTVSKEIGEHRCRRASVLALRTLFRGLSDPHVSGRFTRLWQSWLSGSGTAGRETGPFLVGTKNERAMPGPLAAFKSG